jgi:hypothetical protein
VLLAGGCIIPDAGISPERNSNNPGSVRLVQAVGVSGEANEACSDENPLFLTCPVVPDTVPFGLIDSLDYPLCVCPDRDGNALLEFDIFVEDPDLNHPESQESILGAFLLDLPAAAEGVPDDPSIYLAYQNYLPPTEPARSVPLDEGSYRDAIGRTPPSLNLNGWVLGRDAGVDLCNDNDNTKLAPGMHSLRLVVTDRPWYVEVEAVIDKNGNEVISIADGQPVRRDTPPHLGVPDLPGGATYATADFAFRCGDSNDEQIGPTCNCLAPEAE